MVGLNSPSKLAYSGKYEEKGFTEKENKKIRHLVVVVGGGGVEAGGWGWGGGCKHHPISKTSRKTTTEDLFSSRISAARFEIKTSVIHTVQSSYNS